MKPINNYSPMKLLGLVLVMVTLLSTSSSAAVAPGLSESSPYYNLTK